MPNSARNPEATAKRSPADTLRKDSDFRRVYRRGQSKATPRLVLYVMKRYTASGRGKLRPNDNGTLRTGVSVSAKVGNAVVRNKIRRRVKEILRLNKQRILPEYDIVIVARDKAAAAGFAELERDLLYLLSKTSILKPE